MKGLWFPFTIISLMIPLGTEASRWDRHRPPPPGPPYDASMMGRDAWLKAGFDGEGVIIGLIGYGVDSQHEELKDSWVGKGSGWYDPINGTKFPGETDYQYSSGTYTMGFAVGNETGMAPGARWTACVSCFYDWEVDEYMCPQEYIVKCMEFMACPNPEDSCSYRPDVVIHMWGLDQSAGKHPKADYFDKMLDPWGDMNIVSIFMASFGAHYTQCGNIASPADRDDVITVGYTSNDGRSVHYNSPRGPPELRYPDWEARGIRKPDFLGPTSLIGLLSGGKKGGDNTVGSLCAAGYIGGGVALLRSRNKDLTMRAVHTIFKMHAETNLTLQGAENSCPPNNFTRIGWGRFQLPEPNDTSLPPADPPTRKMPPPPDYNGGPGRLGFKYGIFGTLSAIIMILKFCEESFISHLT